MVDVGGPENFREYGVWYGAPLPSHVLIRGANANVTGCGHDEVDIRPEQRRLVRLICRALQRFRCGKVLTAAERGGATAGSHLVDTTERCADETPVVCHREISTGESADEATRRGVCCCERHA